MDGIIEGAADDVAAALDARRGPRVCGGLERDVFSLDSEQLQSEAGSLPSHQRTLECCQKYTVAARHLVVHASRAHAAHAAHAAADADAGFQSGPRARAIFEKITP